jgi:hypothetical protein
MKMDWKKETSDEMTVYPAGTYYARMSGYERVEAKTGTKQIRWKFEILEPDQYKSKTILEHTALTEAALWRTANLVRALSVDTSNCPSSDTDHHHFDVILETCKERKLFLHVKEEIGQNGSPRNSIVDYKRDESEEMIEPKFDEPIAWEAEDEVKDLV